MPVLGNCVVSLSNNLVDFTSYNNSDGGGNQRVDHSSEVTKRKKHFGFIYMSVYIYVYIAIYIDI